MAKQKKDTPAAGKHARRAGENDLEKTSERAETKPPAAQAKNDLEKNKTSVRAETKRARRIGEKRFRKNKTSVRAKKATPG